MDDELVARRLARRAVTPEDLDDVTLRRIARAIVAQAGCHALGLAFLNQQPDEREVWFARLWFLEDSPTYRLVCRVAGMSPRAVRATICARLALDGGEDAELRPPPQ